MTNKPTKPEKPKRTAVHIRGVDFLAVPGSRRYALLLKFKARDALPTVFKNAPEADGMPYGVVAACVAFAFLLGFSTGWWL